MELRPERDIGLGSLDIFLWRKESDGGFTAGQQQGPICPVGGPPDGHVRVDLRTRSEAGSQRAAETQILTGVIA